MNSFVFQLLFSNQFSQIWQWLLYLNWEHWQSRKERIIKDLGLHFNWTQPHKLMVSCPATGRIWSSILEPGDNLGQLYWTMQMRIRSYSMCSFSYAHKTVVQTFIRTVLRLKKPHKMHPAVRNITGQLLGVDTQRIRAC